MTQPRGFGFYPGFNPPKDPNNWLKVYKRDGITKQTKNYFFLLGADDSEMRENKKILKKK